MYNCLLTILILTVQSNDNDTSEQSHCNAHLYELVMLTGGMVPRATHTAYRNGDSIRANYVVHIWN